MESFLIDLGLPEDEDPLEENAYTTRINTRTVKQDTTRMSMVIITN